MNSKINKNMKKVLPLLVGVLFSSVALYLLFKEVDTKVFVKSFKQVHISFFTLALLCNLITYLIHTKRWSIFFSNKSIKFLWVQTVPLGMYTTTLPREGIRRGKTFRNFKFAEFASRTPPGGIYRGEGQCSSDWAASKRLSFSRLSISKSQILTKSFFTQICLKNASVKFPSHFEHF